MGLNYQIALQIWMSVYWRLTAAMPMQHAPILKGATTAPVTLDTRVMDSAAQVSKIKEL